MGTSSKITVFDENDNALVSIVQTMDGYFEGVGADLAGFLKNMKIVNGLGMNNPNKVANGMGCLAAQIITYLKTNPGGCYIGRVGDGDETYNYKVRLDVTNRVSLIGSTRFGGTTGDKPEIKVFPLYPIVTKNSKPLFAEFVYESASGTKWRRISYPEEKGKYLTGFDTQDYEQYKQFAKDKIVGGMDKVTFQYA